MKLTIEHFNGTPDITVDDRGDTVHIHIMGSPDSLDLALSQDAYDRLLSAASEAGKRRVRLAAGVRVGIADVLNTER